MSSIEVSDSYPITVLIVDDDVWTTRALSLALSGHPRIRPLEPVHSGEAAVSAYPELRPDVVLMDVNMPSGMSGVEATAAIRKLDPDARVVILTTVAPGPGLARALEVGAMAAVSKNASETVLVEIVQTAAQGDDPRLLRHLLDDVLISGVPVPQAPPVAPKLTATELEVLRRICRGHGYQEIAQLMNIAPWTVKTHAKRLREKLDAESLAQLVVRAIQYNYIAG